MSTATSDSPPSEAAARASAAPAGAAPASAARASAAPASVTSAGATSASTADADATRIYRGRTVEELIPKIQAELGDDAIVVRRHKGLTGGIGGFFQRPFVEIEAKAGTPRIDLYDEDDAAPALPPALEQTAPAPLIGGAHPTSTIAALAASDGARGSTPYAALTPSDAGGLAAEAFAAGALADAEFHELTPASLLEDQLAHNGAGPTHSRAAATTHHNGAGPTRNGATATRHNGAGPTRNGTAGPIALQASDPFAAALAEAEAATASAAAEDAPLPSTTPADAASDARPSGDHAPRGRTRGRIEENLLGFGVGEALVRELVETAAAHTLPLMPGRASLARAVHRTLAQRIPSLPPLPVGSATIALIGPGGSGKTACCAALLDAYRERSTLPAACATIVAGQAAGELATLLSPQILEPTAFTAPAVVAALRSAREEGLLLLDLPALSPADRSSIRACTALLDTLKPDRVILALPATFGAKPAAQLLEALRPLATSALAITHVDETDQLGVAVEAACNFGLAPEYLLDRGRGRSGLMQIDPAYLADRLLP